MPEHLIRLRGGWERLDTGAPSPPALWTLPLAARPWGPGRLRLSRRFQAPRIDPAREALWLRLDAVPGLISVALNGREVAHVPTDCSSVFIPLGVDLPARNELTLEAELPAYAGFVWGEVALVIRGPGPSG